MRISCAIIFVLVLGVTGGEWFNYIPTGNRFKNNISLPEKRFRNDILGAPASLNFRFLYEQVSVS